MKIKTLITASSILLVLAAGGYYLTQESEIEHEDRDELNLSEGEGLLASDPTTISGNSSLQEVADVYGIDVSILKSSFHLGEEIDASLFETRDLEHYYLNLDESIEVGNEAMQAFVALNNGLDFELIDIYLPTEAIEYLTKNQKLSQEQSLYFETHSVLITEVSLVDVELDSESGNTISGNTTLQDLINLGLTIEQIETVSGIKISDTNMLLRDYAENNGLSYGGLKEDIEVLLNS